MSEESDSKKGGKTIGQKLVYGVDEDTQQTELGYLLASIRGSLAPRLRLAGRLLVTAVVLALAAAVILNLRYKPLGLVEVDALPPPARPWMAYIDTWTGTPHFCAPSVDRVGLVCITAGGSYTR